MNTKIKGSLGELKVATDLLEKGFKVAFPFGESEAYDLILDRNGSLEKVQVKYVESNNEIIKVRCHSFLSAKNSKSKKSISTPYSERVDWIAVFDKTTNCCYYIHNSQLPLTGMHLRLSPAKNNNLKLIKWAKDYLAPNLPE